MAHLAINAGLPPRIISLKPGTLVAGRSLEADLPLEHPEVSRAHCRFRWNGSNWLIEDLDSARGTRINGAAITSPTQLNEGDQIGLGPVLLQFGLGAAPVIPARELDKSATHQSAATDRIELTGSIVIGRDPQVDVVLNNPAVSRRHAQIEHKPNGGYVVTDLNSSAGSFVNGRRFDQHELTVGDRLQIGPFCFQFDGQALVQMANAGGCIEASQIVSRAGSQIILDTITLTVPASRFVGIIGPSGAGKSSLLHVLAGLHAPDGGRVLLDDADVYQAGTQSSFGFVPQEDIVHPELTVSEGLRFSARLRLPPGTPGLELQKLLIQTMDQLGLKARADFPIARLSGGQRKRVSVGVELLGKPAVMFLDEPTSGLDPATEFQLMELLRDLADTGCTIICTTHVMENAFLMDQLAVLVGGCLAFSGSPQEAREYFGVTRLNALYDQLLNRPAKEWQTQFAPRQEREEVIPKSPSLLSRPRRPFALPILLARQWAILRSDWRNFGILLGQPLIIAALVCWVTDERALVMFFAYLATLWFGCANAAQEVVKELAIYRRERLIGVGAHSYLSSKFIFLTGVTFIQSMLLYGAMLLGEHGRDGTVAWQLSALFGTALAGVGIGLTLSALSRTVMQAVIMVPLIIIPQIVFSGYTVPASDMTPAVRWVSRCMPSYSAQTIFDTSFLWMKPLRGETINNHAQAYRNLDPDRRFTSRDIYNRKEPALLALMVLGFWAVGAYLASWLALKRRERI